MYNLEKSIRLTYFYSMKVILMRRIFASAIAIAVIGTSLSSCGQVEEPASNENEISSASEVKSDYDSDSNDENIKDNFASDDLSKSDDDVSNSSNILSSDLSGDASELSFDYENVIRAYFDASNEGEITKKSSEQCFQIKKLRLFLNLPNLEQIILWKNYPKIRQTI